MDCRKVNVVLVLVILTLLSAVYTVLSTSDEDVLKSELKIKELQLKADSISAANIILEKRIQSQLSKINEIEEQIKIKDSKINQLRKDVEENISSVDTAGYNDLVRFFTDRYNQGFSTYPDSSSYN